MNTHGNRTRFHRRWPVCVAVHCIAFASAIGAQNHLVAWGNGPTNIPSCVTNVASVSLSSACIAVLRDGRICAWSFTNAPASATNIPPAATNVASASASGYGYLALRRDGQVIDSSGVVRASNAVAALAANEYGAGALGRDGVFVGWGGLWAPASNTSNVVALAKGGYATLRVLFSDGTVSPTPAGLSAPVTNIVAMADGNYPTFLTSQGTVISAIDQAGILAGLSNVVAIASGGWHGLALKRDGQVVAWGDNTHGQTNVPAGLSNVVSIAAGFFHSVALKADGRVVAWGENSGGQTNVPSDLTNAAAIFATGLNAAIVGDSPPSLLNQPPDLAIWRGQPTTFSVQAVGSPPLRFQWQLNGESIDGATNAFLRINACVPADSGNYNVIVSNDRGVAASRDAALLVRDDPYFLKQPTNQTVLAGGGATFQSLAAGSQRVSYRWFFEGTPIPGATNSALKLTNIALAQAGAYWVEARNAVGTRTSTAASLIVRVITTWGSPNRTIPNNLLGVRSIAAGGGNCFVLMPDGDVAFWGEDDYVWPGMRFTGISNIVAFAPGHQFVLALLADGSVIGKGLNNTYGQASIPVGLSNIVNISAGYFHSLALRADGSVVAWGGNFYGQTNVPRDLTNVVSIAAGGYHSLALRADGSIASWGYNEYGQTNSPAALSNVVAVAGGGHHSVALLDDGQVRVWGHSAYGQTNIPAGLENVISIAAGFGHCLALRADGTVVAWGLNDFNQASVPSYLRNVVAIAAGHSHSIVLRAEGLVSPAFGIVNPTQSGPAFVVQVPTTRGANYYLQHQNPLGSTGWIISPPTPGDGTVRSLADPHAADPQRYYRVWRKP